MGQLDKGEMTKMSAQLASVDRRLGLVEERVTGLDARVKVVEQDLAVIKSNYATKADVSDAKVSIIMWIVATVLFAQLIPQLIKAFGG